MADEKFECPVFFRASSSGLLRLHGPKSRHCPGSHQTVNQEPSSSPSVIRQVSTTCPSLTNHAVASSPDCPGSTYPPAVPQSSRHSCCPSCLEYQPFGDSQRHPVVWQQRSFLLFWRVWSEITHHLLG